MRRLDFIATVFFAASALLAAQNTVGPMNQAFEAPAGWERQDTPGAIVFTARDAPPNQVALILSGRPLEGPFAEAFNQEVASLNQKFRIASSKPAAELKGPDGSVRMTAIAELAATNGVHFFRLYYAANPPGRIETLVFTTITQAQFRQHMPAVQQFISTWTFANAATQPQQQVLPPPPAATAMPQQSIASPAGVYLGYKYAYVTVLGAVQKRAQNEYLTLFPDGSVFRYLPHNGLVRLNTRMEVQKSPESAGMYQLNGDLITIAIDRGRFLMRGTWRPALIEIEGRPYRLQGDPAKSAAHGLDGVFVREDARPGEDLARRSIRFTRDGQFLDQGIIQTIATSEIINGNPTFDRPGGRGTYRLENYTILLRYSDGYERHLPVTIAPEDMEKPLLMRLQVNTYSLVRR